MIYSQKKNSQGKKKVIVNNKLQCSYCKYLLDISNFHRDKNSATGYKSDCKVCAKRHKREKLKKASTSGIVGIFLEKCAYKSCQKDFTTKTPTKAYCSAKCRKRDWYEKNEQHKWKIRYKTTIREG